MLANKIHSFQMGQRPEWSNLSEGPTLARFSARWTLWWETLCPHRMSGLCLHRALALYLLFFWMPSSDAFLKGFDFVDAESPGRSCMVHGRSGVCMYSMVCTYAGGQHLGTCRLASASRVKVKHCQRHNGPEGWVHLAKVTSWSLITSSNTYLDHILSSESRLSIN